MHFSSHKVVVSCGLLACFYIATFVGIRLIQPWSINSNDGPGPIYRCAFYPLRFADSTKPQWFWSCVMRGGWITAKIIWNNPGNGYLTFETPGGLYRAVSGWDLRGARQGEVVKLKCGFELATYDDFSDHLLPSIEEVIKTPNHVPDPTSPSVTPPACAGGAPSVAADH